MDSLVVEQRRQGCSSSIGREYEIRATFIRRFFEYVVESRWSVAKMSMDRNRSSLADRQTGPVFELSNAVGHLFRVNRPAYAFFD